MFASPPPPTRSKSEIRVRLHARTKSDGSFDSAEPATSSPGSFEQKSPPVPPAPNRNDSHSPIPRKKGFFNVGKGRDKDWRPVVSAPISSPPPDVKLPSPPTAQLPLPPPPPLPPLPSTRERKERPIRSTPEHVRLTSKVAAWSPLGKSPQPPKRPPRPPSLLLSADLTTPGALPPSTPSCVFGSADNDTASATSASMTKSISLGLPSSRQPDLRSPQPLSPVKAGPLFNEEFVNKALAELSTANEARKTAEKRASEPSRSAIGPATLRRSSSTPATKSAMSSVLSPSKDGVRGGKIEKVVTRRPSISSAAIATALQSAGLANVEKPTVKRQAPTIRRGRSASSSESALLGFDNAVNIESTRAASTSLDAVTVKKASASDPADLQVSPTIPRPQQLSVALKETPNKRIDSALYPGESQVQTTISEPKMDATLPPPVPFKEKALPDTPTSIVTTPDEMYQGDKRTIKTREAMLRTLKQAGTAQRSPLAQVTNINTKVKPLKIEDVSPRLVAIPENISIKNGRISMKENTSPVLSIRLRGGSVVTVTTPEMTAWKKVMYTQGPIKLPKPVILPRKNSVASLEPFQDVIEKVYQDALSMPRRRSDDAVADDICEFFEGYGFHDVHYGGDMLVTGRVEADTADEMDIDEPEHFSTPPDSPPMASTIEQVVARDVVMKQNRSLPMPKFDLPPIETEETLRARGIARLSHATKYAVGKSAVQARAAGIATKAKPTLPLLPLPEETMLEVARMEESTTSTTMTPSTPDAVTEIEQTIRQRVDPGGMDWDDDIEETDASAPWLSPHRRRALQRAPSSREKVNTVSKMRRFVANASGRL